KKTVLTLSMQNRKFNASLRDTYFEKALHSFSEFNDDYSMETPLFSASAKILDFQSSIDTALEYSKTAVAGVKTDERASHSEAGFFREEILFMHLLDDCASACRYVSTRQSTINELADYRKKISALSLAGKQKGYVSRILNYIDEKRSRDDIEIRQILKQVKHSLAIAETIFSTIKIKTADTASKGKTK
ncbi:MAG: hypothetical protein JNL74_06850, partial [Fibrobacteres bacterium]|nr:hypothetical protein [Fibrobacterota bacterium]